MVDVDEEEEARSKFNRFGNIRSRNEPRKTSILILDPQNLKLAMKKKSSSQKADLLLHLNHLHGKQNTFHYHDMLEKQKQRKNNLQDFLGMKGSNQILESRLNDQGKLQPTS